MTRDIATMAAHCRQQAAGLARTLDMAHEDLRHAVAQDHLGVPTTRRTSPLTPTELRRTIADLEADRALWTQLADEATAYLNRDHHAGHAAGHDEVVLFDEEAQP